MHNFGFWAVEPGAKIATFGSWPATLLLHCHEIFLVVSRFPRCISCYIAESGTVYNIHALCLAGSGSREERGGEARPHEAHQVDKQQQQKQKTTTTATTTTMHILGICPVIKFVYSTSTIVEVSIRSHQSLKSLPAKLAVRQVLADFAVCDWRRYCKALCDEKFG